MANKVEPYHTITPEQDDPGHRNVYPTYSDCPDDSRIRPETKRSGKAG